MTRHQRALSTRWLGSAFVVLGMGCLAARPARTMAAGNAWRQDPAKPAPDAQPVTRSVREGVYSSKQAGRGEQSFGAQCGTCHKPEQFTGAYLDGWEGRTTSGLFELIRTSMPQDDPGSLTRQEYADILAFLLKKNGLPAGAADLSSASADLRQIVIVK